MILSYAYYSKLFDDYEYFSTLLLSFITHFFRERIKQEREKLDREWKEKKKEEEERERKRKEEASEKKLQGHEREAERVRDVEKMRKEKEELAKKLAEERAKDRLRQMAIDKLKASNSNGTHIFLPSFFLSILYLLFILILFTSINNSIKEEDWKNRSAPLADLPTPREKVYADTIQQLHSQIEKITATAQADIINKIIMIIIKKKIILGEKEFYDSFYRRRNLMKRGNIGWRGLKVPSVLISLKLNNKSNLSKNVSLLSLCFYFNF